MALGQRSETSFPVRKLLSLMMDGGCKLYSRFFKNEDRELWEVFSSCMCRWSDSKLAERDRKLTFGEPAALEFYLALNKIA